jgi:hypothetical protein
MLRASHRRGRSITFGKDIDPPPMSIACFAKTIICMAAFSCAALAQSPMKPTFVYAKLLEKIGPIDRGERYEEPLDAALKKEGLGECDGGGTMQAKDGEIEYIGLDIKLNNLERGIPFVVRFLEDRGVAAGSMLEIEGENGQKKIRFGKVEGIGIYLDGVNLPADVYKKCDVNVVIDELEKKIKPNGHMRAYWQGPKETALYFYGRNASEMEKAMKQFLDTYPLCRNARVVVLARQEDENKK